MDHRCNSTQLKEQQAQNTENEWINNNAGASTYWSLEMNKTAANIRSERNKGAVEFIHNEAVKQVSGCVKCMM